MPLVIYLSIGFQNVTTQKICQTISEWIFSGVKKGNYREDNLKLCHVIQYDSHYPPVGI